MIISRAQLDRVLATYMGRSGQVRQQKEAAAKAEKADAGAVQLSAQAQEVKKIKMAIADLPEIRRELVAGLKAAVEEGSYQVDPEAVADKMLERLLADAAQEDS